MMMLLILLVIPVIGAVLMRTASSQSIAGNIALGVSSVGAIFTIYMAMIFNPEGGFQHQLLASWIPELGISFNFGIDGIGMVMLLLTNILVPLIIASSFNREIKSFRTFYALILVMQFALIGVFSSLDGFLFYVFWELALIPIWFICLLWGGSDRFRITLKFFIYTLSGSLLMLLGFIYVYLHTEGVHSFDINALYNASLTPDQESWIFWAFFLAFAIKIPLFPLHTWQPDTYTDAPAQGTMLLSAIMLKMGLYGILRWLMPIVPLGMAMWVDLVAVFTVIGVVYASLMALVQKDFKRLIAYSSIAHVGVIAVGLFTISIQGIQGGIYQMLSHGVNVVGIFLVADILQRNTGTRIMTEQGGLAKDSKLFSIAFIVILLGSIALPLTNGFVGEFLILLGLYEYSYLLAFFAGLTVIIGAVYMLNAFQKIMLGDRHIEKSKMIKLSQSESICLVIILGLVIIMGVYPDPIMRIAEPSVIEIIRLTNNSI